MSAGWGLQHCISHMPFKLLVSPTTPVCQRQELKNPGSFSAFNQQKHLMESSKFSRFPSCLSSKTPNRSPPLWITLRLGYGHPDELPATSLQEQAHPFSASCNWRSNLFPLVSFHSTHYPRLSFPSSPLWSSAASSDPFCTTQSTCLTG